MNNRKKTKISTTSFTDGVTQGECIFNIQEQRTEFIIQSKEGQVFQLQYTKDQHKLEPPTQVRRLVLSNTLKLPTEAAPYDTSDKLISKVRELIHRYVDLSETFETICTHYVLLTWLYDRYNELPYLRVRGDYGSGKTRFLAVIGSLCYKPIFASGASTTAPLFHLLNDIQGTLVLDESDFKYSDTTAELTKILNNGNAKGFSVLRCEPSTDGRFVAKAYNIFGPKIIASRESFKDDALESRCITEDLGNKPLRSDIPISLPDSFEAEALQLRNQLLQYRLDHRGRSVLEADFNSSALAGRTRQIYLPLLSLIRDSEEFSLVQQRIVDYEAQLRSDRGLQTEAELLQVIKLLQGEGKPLSITEITKKFVLQFGTRYVRRVTPKWIGCLLRSRLHLATRKANGVYIISEGQEEKLKRLMQVYDVI